MMPAEILINRSSNRKTPKKLGVRSWKRVPDDFLGIGVWRNKDGNVTKKVRVKVVRHLGYGHDDNRNHVGVVTIQKNQQRVDMVAPAHDIFYQPRSKSNAKNVKSI